MAEEDEILVVSPGDRTPGPSTPGMERQQAVATDSMWSGAARTEAGMVSGWHHHVLTGALLMEFGPDGSSTVEDGPGGFVYVPKGAVHREQSFCGESPLSAASLPYERQSADLGTSGTASQQLLAENPDGDGPPSWLEGQHAPMTGETA